MRCTTGSRSSGPPPAHAAALRLCLLVPVSAHRSSPRTPVQVRTEIGPFAAPDVIHWAPGLPKTRSGARRRAQAGRSAVRACALPLPHPLHVLARLHISRPLSCPSLPTSAGKIMRRILRKIAANKLDELGDTSTLADPGVVQVLIDLRGK